MFNTIIIQSFGTFTTSQMIFLSFILMGFLFAAIQIRSAVSGVVWGFTAIVLVGVMEFGLPIRLFWFSLILNVIALMLSFAAYTYLNQNI